MLFTNTSTNTKATPSGDGLGCGYPACVAFGDVESLSDAGLTAELSLLGRYESRLAARKAKLLAELAQRSSSGDAQQVVVGELLISKREAKKEVENACQLESLPETSATLESGDIAVGHAKLIAQTALQGEIVEGELVGKAKTEKFDDFAKTVRKHQNEQANKAGVSVLERQRKKRSVRVFESPETAMLVLNAEFDQITGARIMTALTAKENTIWRNEDPANRATPQQRRADALAELILRTPHSKSKQVTNLLVLVDYCVLKQLLNNPRLATGSPITIDALRELAVEANILPAVFNNKTQRLWLGRAQRTASAAQRIALTARDKHCIGCGTDPLWCRAHHIKYWSHGGNTDIDNLTLVCDRCHHKIHDQNWQIHQHPTTKKLELQPPPAHPQHRRTNKQHPPSKKRLRGGEPMKDTNRRTNKQHFWREGGVEHRIAAHPQHRKTNKQHPMRGKQKFATSPASIPQLK